MTQKDFNIFKSSKFSPGVYFYRKLVYSMQTQSGFTNMATIALQLEIL